MVFSVAALCWVLAVHDGDSLRVRCEGAEPVAVRVAFVDAPELGQPWGRASGASLRRLCLHTQAWVVPQVVDRYGRTVATVQCRAKDASHHQVERGMAWVFTRYAPVGSPLFADEARARAARRGLWRDANPVEPAQYRMAHATRGKNPE